MKKGFTLIELLAVIVILAIIALIAVPIVLNIINSVRSSMELENARGLVKLANNYIASQQLKGTYKKEQQVFVIIDDIQYKIEKDGSRIESNYFSHKGKLCDYCIVKIRDDKKIYVLYEGVNQDIIKEYDSGEFIKNELKQPREVVSLYNELVLFKDIYIMKNNIESAKFFKSGDDSIYEVLNTGEEVEVSKLYNSFGQSKIKFIDSDNYVVTITTEEGIYEFDSKGIIAESENLNNKYSDEILALYNEIMISAERYLLNNTVDGEEYFEFSDGVINKLNQYGQVDELSTMVINPNSKGSGELRINSSNQVSIVIYDDTNDIKCDYGSTLLYSEPIKYSRDGITLIKNLSRLELVAEEYTGGNKTTSDWLVFYYLRQLKYKDNPDSIIKKYNVVTGDDTDFVSHVNTYKPNLYTYFNNKNTYTINGHKIDLKHMAASLAGNLYDTLSLYHLAYEELEYDSLISWAGDLHTLMEKSILKSGVKEQYGNYLNATYQLMGKSNTSFSMEDVYADIDAWGLYYNMKENPNLSIGEIFDKYYSGESSRSYKNRYTSFISIMNTIATQFKSSKGNFEGVVSYFTSNSKSWLTIGTLEITPTNAERQEIADGFIKWIKDQAAKE